MNAEFDRTSTRERTGSRTTSRRQPKESCRRQHPMPRSTTRVIWTMSQGTLVDFGSID